MTTEENQPQSKFWACKGRGEKWPHEAQRFHPELTLSSDKCSLCGKARPSQSIARKGKISFSQSGPSPKKDPRLLAGLITLNLVSGFTTMRGAAQLLPPFAGYTAGGMIQLLLFLLLSSYDTLRHRPRIKWIVTGCLAIFSIYTSFFAYYELLTQKNQEIDGGNRALAAHQNLVTDVFTPINRHLEDLNGKINNQDFLIQQEKNGRRQTGQQGCGNECRKLIFKKEELQREHYLVKQLVEKLEPLFQYKLDNMNSNQIYQNDLIAIAALRKCQNEKQHMDCLPGRYVSVSDPSSPQYNNFKLKYVDEDLRDKLFAPIIKIAKLEPSAIGAALFSLLVDGSIIALGVGIEARPKSKELKFPVLGLGSKFLTRLSQALDPASLVIDLEPLHGCDNYDEYVYLLNHIRAETDWIKQYDNQKWEIISEAAERSLNSWFARQKDKQLRLEIEFQSLPSNDLQQKIIALQLPTPYDY